MPAVSVVGNMRLGPVAFLLLALCWESRAQFFQFPDFYLQAATSGSLRAYMPEPCGDVEKLKFEWKKGGLDDWRGGPFLGPYDGYWMYEDPSAQLQLGDALSYKASLVYNGIDVDKPETKWNISDLVEEFKPPPPHSKECANTTTTTEPATTPSNANTTTGMPEKTTTPVPELPPPDSPLACGAPWLLRPEPTDTRDVALEKQVLRLQCELTGFTSRYSKLANAMEQELTDLKKLNYAMVARMQRLEAMLRAGPPPFGWP